MGTGIQGMTPAELDSAIEATEDAYADAELRDELELLDRLEKLRSERDSRSAAKITLDDRHLAALRAVARRDNVNVHFVQLVIGESDWATCHDIIDRLKLAGLVRWMFAGTRVTLTDAGRALLDGGAK